MDSLFIIGVFIGIFLGQSIMAIWIILHTRKIIKMLTEETNG